MTFNAPAPSDYANVYALNRAFLNLARRGQQQFELNEFEYDRLIRLGTKQTESLARVPFLLFSLQLHDQARWREILLGCRNPDLFVNTDAASSQTRELITATVSFLRQLAHSNEYALYLITGSHSGWPEMIGEVTYFELATCIGRQPDLLKARRAVAADIWAKLLYAGVNADREVRKAAHIAVLQTLITDKTEAATAQWPLAACKTIAPLLRVAENPDQS